MSGLMASAEANAALKEWPVMCLAASPRVGVRSSISALFMMPEVSNLPFDRMNTGSFDEGLTNF
jgi:hypothetical protein